MFQSTIRCGALTLGCIFATTAGAQLLNPKDLSPSLAMTIAQTAIETCKANGYAVSATVVGRNGEIIVQVRGDNTGPHTIENSMRKAYTARTFRSPSGALVERLKADPTLGLIHLSNVIANQGALPIKVGEETIGAAGASGAPGGEKDEACVKAGIDKAASILKEQGVEPRRRPVRIGFLVPPGNPTVEVEMIALAPPQVSVHFTRMVAHGAAGSHQGQEERNRSQIAHLSENVALLAMVAPKVIVLAHTATSYTLGKKGEAELVARMQRETGIPFISAFGSVLAALAHLNVKRIAFGTPYDADATAKGKASLEAHGIEVVSVGRLENVKNIYEETAERAHGLARRIDVPQAQAVFLSGVGMPTIATLERMERDLGKPVVSAAAAMMWNALRVAGVPDPLA